MSTLPQELNAPPEEQEWDDYWTKPEVVRKHSTRNNAYQDVFRLLDRLAPTDARCIEVGCGSGTYAIELRRSGRRALAADFSPGALRIARLKAQNLYVLPIPCLRADLFALPFPDDTFDLIFSDGVIEHLDVLEALKAMRHKLKPGGWLVTKVPSGNLLYRGVYRALSNQEIRPFEAWHPPAVWLQFARDAGLKDVRLEKCGGLLPGTFKRLFGNRPLARWLPNIGRIHFVFYGRK